MKQIWIILLVVILFLMWYNMLIKKDTTHINNRMLKYFSPDYLQNTIQPLKNGKIFVSIASYRDPLLQQTINSLLKTCDNRLLLRVVICEQNSTVDDFSLKDFPTEVEVIRMPHADARGPCWARYLIQQEYQGEEFYLQIDSHTKFLNKGWDTSLKKMLENLPEKACLSNYVASFNHKTGKLNGSPLRGPMHVVKVDRKDKFVRFNSQYILAMDKPMLSFGWKTF
jgi:hypothetical protein